MDESLIAEMIGKVVLVGVTVRSRKEEIIGQEQYFGTVLRISERDGLIIRRGDTGEELWLPPAIHLYEPAKPGEYRLRSTGQIVSNPDYVASFTKYPKDA